MSACTCRYELNWVGCLLVIFHDFLDHVDGIVAKVQRRVLGNVDDPLLGGFMDAFCDKVSCWLHSLSLPHPSCPPLPPSLLPPHVTVTWRHR